MLRNWLALLAATVTSFAVEIVPLAPTRADVPYAGTTDFRQTLNVYAPAKKSATPATSPRPASPPARPAFPLTASD